MTDYQPQSQAQPQPQLQPQPQPFHSLYATGQPLYIGDRIKLFTTSPYHLDSNNSTGYIGVASNPISRHGGDTPPVISIPPHDIKIEEFFQPQIFTILSSNEEINFRAQNGKREPVLFGMTLILVAEDGSVWNNKTKGLKGTLTPRPRGINGEIWISFDAPGKTLSNVCVGDTVTINVDNNHRRKYSHRLTVYRPEQKRLAHAMDKIKNKLHRDHSAGNLFNKDDNNNGDNNQNQNDNNDDHTSNNPEPCLITTNHIPSSTLPVPNPQQKDQHDTSPLPTTTTIHTSIPDPQQRPHQTDDSTHTLSFPSPPTPLQQPQQPQQSQQTAASQHHLSVPTLSIVCNGKGLPLVLTIHHFEQHITNCGFPYRPCKKWICGTENDDRYEDDTANNSQHNHVLTQQYNHQNMIVGTVSTKNSSNNNSNGLHNKDGQLPSQQHSGQPGQLQTGSALTTTTTTSSQLHPKPPQPDQSNQSLHQLSLQGHNANTTSSQQSKIDADLNNHLDNNVTTRHPTTTSSSSSSYQPQHITLHPQHQTQQSVVSPTLIHSTSSISIVADQPSLLPSSHHQINSTNSPIVTIPLQQLPYQTTPPFHNPHHHHIDDQQIHGDQALSLGGGLGGTGGPVTIQNDLNSHDKPIFSSIPRLNTDHNTQHSLQQSNTDPKRGISGGSVAGILGGLRATRDRLFRRHGSLDQIEMAGGNSVPITPTNRQQQQQQQQPWLHQQNNRTDGKSNSTNLNNNTVPTTTTTTVSTLNTTSTPSESPQTTPYSTTTNQNQGHQSLFSRTMLRLNNITRGGSSSTSTTPVQQGQNLQQYDPSELQQQIYNNAVLQCANCQCLNAFPIPPEPEPILPLLSPQPPPTPPHHHLHLPHLPHLLHHSNQQQQRQTGSTSTVSRSALDERYLQETPRSMAGSVNQGKGRQEHYSSQLPTIISPSNQNNEKNQNKNETNLTKNDGNDNNSPEAQDDFEPHFQPFSRSISSPTLDTSGIDHIGNGKSDDDDSDAENPHKNTENQNQNQHPDHSETGESTPQSTTDHPHHLSPPLTFPPWDGTATATTTTSTPGSPNLLPATTVHLSSTGSTTRPLTAREQKQRLKQDKEIVRRIEKEVERDIKLLAKSEKREKKEQKRSEKEQSKAERDQVKEYGSSGGGDGHGNKRFWLRDDGNHDGSGPGGQNSPFDHPQNDPTYPANTHQTDDTTSMTSDINSLPPPSTTVPSTTGIVGGVGALSLFNMNNNTAQNNNNGQNNDNSDNTMVVYNSNDNNTQSKMNNNQKINQNQVSDGFRGPPSLHTLPNVNQTPHRSTPQTYRNVEQSYQQNNQHNNKQHNKQLHLIDPKTLVQSHPPSSSNTAQIPVHTNIPATTTTTMTLAPTTTTNTKNLTQNHDHNQQQQQQHNQNFTYTRNRPLSSSLTPQQRPAIAPSIITVIVGTYIQPDELSTLHTVSIPEHYQFVPKEKSTQYFLQQQSIAASNDSKMPNLSLIHDHYAAPLKKNDISSEELIASTGKNSFGGKIVSISGGKDNILVKTDDSDKNTIIVQQRQQQLIPHPNNLQSDSKNLSFVDKLQELSHIGPITTTSIIYCGKCTKRKKICQLSTRFLIFYLIICTILNPISLHLYTLPSLIILVITYLFQERHCGHISQDQIDQINSEPTLTIPLSSSHLSLDQIHDNTSLDNRSSSGNGMTSSSSSGNITGVVLGTTTTGENNTEQTHLSISLTSINNVHSLVSFSNGINKNGTLTPQQGLELINSSLFYPAFAAFGVEIFNPEDLQSILTPQGLLPSKYRLPLQESIDQIRVIQSTIHPLPLLTPELKLNKGFPRLITAVCADMPQRFIDAEGGDVQKAKDRWYLTKKWRHEANLDRILIQPYTLFPVMRKLCGHFYHGFDRQGNFIYVDRPGMIQFPKIKAAFTSNGGGGGTGGGGGGSGGNIDPEIELQRHFLHGCEYQWNIINASPTGKCFSILDLSGLGFMSIVSGPALPFVKKLSGLLQQHYPVRSSHIIIVNVPSWFSKLWSIISPLLHERTRQKVIICGNDVNEISKTLLQFIDSEQLPSFYGGNCKCPGGCDVGHPLENQYREFVHAVNQQAQQQQQTK